MTKKHSVLLREEDCEGCTNCVKSCPTRAIRVHEGKAAIREELCIDCAECIRICEYHAKYTRADPLQEVKQYHYPVVVVPPSFYGQFKKKDPREVMYALRQLGFKKVFNAARAAEALSQKTAELINASNKYFISSSCPVVVRLIQKKYPELLKRLAPYKSPVELTAQVARQELTKEKQLKEGDIGVFFITPCPAKLTSVYSPSGLEESFLDRALSAEKVYENLLPVFKQIRKKKIKKEGLKEQADVTCEGEWTPLPVLPYEGFSWGQSGGEAEVLQKLEQKRILSVSGIKQVQRVLDELVRENISGVKYFEMVSCPRGCVGGVLNIKNPYQAQYNLQRLVSEARGKLSRKDLEYLRKQSTRYEFLLEPGPRPQQVDRLDPSMEQALKKLDQLEEEKEILPGLDCASCGAPDCETLAEDIVQGLAQRTDCIFMLRQEIQNLAEKITNLTYELPPVMSEKKKEKEEGDS